MWARIDGEEKAKLLFSFTVGLRTCRVCCCDLKGVEHVVEVTADSLYEAVAQGLRAFRENDWVDDVGGGLTTITVLVSQPSVEDKVRVRDFEQWLEAQGRTPAEMSLKSRLRELMRKPREAGVLAERDQPPDAIQPAPACAPSCRCSDVTREAVGQADGAGHARETSATVKKRQVERSCR
jgi:hypothetical protein